MRSPIDMRLSEVVLAAGVVAGFSMLVGFAPRYQSGSGVAQVKQLGQGIRLYAADANDVYPLGIGRDATSGQWLWNRSIEAPAGVRRDTSPEVAEAFRSTWVNSVTPYWPSLDALKIPDAPTAEPKMKLEDTVRDPWLVGVNYNGLLHDYPGGALPHPELVPTIWTGQGRANRHGLINSLPTLMCGYLGGSSGLCRFNSDAQPGFTKSAMFVPMGPAAVFEGNILLAMADGSVKHIVPNKQPTKDPDDPWGAYDVRGHGISFWQVGGYPPLFRPDRAPTE